MDAISKSKLIPVEWASDLVRDFLRQYDSPSGYIVGTFRVKFEAIPAGAEILQRSQRDRAHLVVAVAARLDELCQTSRSRGKDVHDQFGKDLDALKLLADRLLQGRLSFEDAELAAVLDLAAEYAWVMAYPNRGIWRSPVLPQLQLVKQADGREIHGSLAGALRRLRGVLDSSEASDAQLAQRIQRLLDGSAKPESSLRKSPWQKLVATAVAALPGATADRARQAIELALAEGRKAKPSEKWLTKARPGEGRRHAASPRDRVDHSPRAAGSRARPERRRHPRSHLVHRRFRR